MLTLKIRQPLQRVRMSAPLSAQAAATKLCAIFGDDARISLADVAFNPEHPETIYVWEVFHPTWEVAIFVWSDSKGQAGLADESGLI